MAMIGPLTLNIFQPSMPRLTRELGAPRDIAQLTLSLYIFSMGVAQIVSGPLADRFGRRPVVLTALGLYVASSIAGFFAASLPMLVAARIGQALGATACLGLSRTVTADLSDRAGTARVIAYTTMAMVIAPMASPNIGATIDEIWGWRTIFMVCAAAGIAVAVYCLLQLEETRPGGLTPPTGREVYARSLALLRNRGFLRYAALATLGSACFFTILGATPHLIIEVMQRPPTDYARWFMVMSVGYALGNFATGRYTAAIGIDRMISLGNLIQTGGIVIMTGLALVPMMHPAAIFLPAMLVTLGNGMVLPNALAAGIQTDRLAAGAATGLAGFAQLLFASVASYVVLLLPGQTALPMALMMLGFAVLAQIVLPLSRTSRPDG